VIRLFGAGLALSLGVGLRVLSCLPAETKSTQKKNVLSTPAPIAQVTGDAFAAPMSSYTASSTMGFEQSQAMVPFYERLARLGFGEARAPLHILHFGDSHTVADNWTGAMRNFFQQKFGNGGSGYSLAGHPFAGYRRFGTRHGATPDWQTDGLNSGEGDGYFGLGGVSINTRRAGQSVFIEAECSEVSVYYLRMPGGGEVELFDNNQSMRQFSTDGAIEAAMVSYRTSPGVHNLRLVTLQNRPVRILGWSTDLDSGITYESLGINGAQASIFFRWKETMIASYLKQRDPSLIVLAYGSNEAGDSNSTIERYQVKFSALLKRLRGDCPTASILVLGPTDRMMRTRTGVVQVQGIDRIIAAQRIACAENRCAYWNAKLRMGGSGSIRDWTIAGLGQRDYVHFTAPGYERLAHLLFGDMMRLYDEYLKVRVPYSKQNSQPISEGQ
jgi:lysophospholipase L1-like esterase